MNPTDWGKFKIILGNMGWSNNVTITGLDPYELHEAPAAYYNVTSFTIKGLSTADWRDGTKLPVKQLAALLLGFTGHKWLVSSCGLTLMAIKEP